MFTSSGTSRMNHSSRSLGIHGTVLRTSGWRFATAIAMIAGVATVSVTVESTANARGRWEQGIQDERGRKFPTAERIRETLTGDFETGQLNQNQIDAILKAHAKMLKKLEAGDISDEAATSRFDRQIKSIYAISDGRKSSEPLTAPTIDLAQIRVEIDERMTAMARDLDKRVEVGDLTRAQADERYAATNRRMELRYQELEKRQRTKEEAEANQDLEALKKQIEQRLESMSEDLRKQVEAGEIGEIDARTTFDQAEKKMWNRYRAAEIERAETRMKSELDALRKRIEQRLLAMSQDLRSKISKGEISKAEAKATFDDAEEKLWNRYRATEAKLKGRKKFTQAEYNAEVTKMIDMIKTGTITSEEFLVRVEMMEENMVATEDDSEARTDARVEAMVRHLKVTAKKSRDEEKYVRFSEMVANGEMTEEEMQLRLVEFREADHEDAEDVEKVLDYQGEYLRMFEMVKNNEMTMADMQQQLVELRMVAAGETEAAKGLARYQSEYLRMFELVKNNEMKLMDMHLKLAAIREEITKDSDEGRMVGQIEEQYLRMIKMVANKEMTIEQMQKQMNRAMQMDD